MDAQALLITNVDATPSARVIEEMRRNDTGFFHFAIETARGHKEYFSELEPLADKRLQIYTDEARQSIEKQMQIEASDDMNFDEYLRQYFSEQGCCD